VRVKSGQSGIVCGCGRSFPPEVNDCFRVVVEGQSAGAVLAVVGADLIVYSDLRKYKPISSAL